MRSMTGFGAASAPCAAGVVRVELRSVNHRFFEVRARTAGPLSDVSGELEEALRKRLERGRIDATVRIEGESATLDRARVGALIRELGALRDEHAPGAEFPWPLVVAELGATRAPAATDELRAAMLLAAQQAATALDAMRRVEGDALRAELERHLAVMHAELDAIEHALPGILAAHHAKLGARVAALLTGEARVPDDRLAQEVAIVADRMDVTEELARARAHLALFTSLLSSDEAVGRKLDFVTQEMLRETNTIGSKVADAAVAHRVITLKATVERLREQVQNIL